MTSENGNGNGHKKQSDHSARPHIDPSQFLPPPGGDCEETLYDLSHASPDELEEKELALAEWLTQNPADANAWIALGFILESRGQRFDEALKAYRKATEIDPGNIWAWQNLGENLSDSIDSQHENHPPDEDDRIDEAEQAFRKAIEIDPDCARTWANLGRLLSEERGHYNEAQRCYRQAIALDPEYDWAWGQFGLLLHDFLGDYKEAEKCYRKAIELDPDDPWDCAQLVRLLFEALDRPKDAVRIAETFLEQTGRNAEALNEMALAIYDTDLDEYLPLAESWAEEAVQKSPDNPSTAYTLAAILSARGHWEDALEIFPVVLSVDEIVDDNWDDIAEFFIDAAAAGFPREALEIIENSPSADLLLPLEIGLRLFLREDLDLKTDPDAIRAGREIAREIQIRGEEDYDSD